MIRFIGIMMKFSVMDMNLGDYRAYWNDNVYIKAGSNYHIKLVGHVPWERDVMTLRQFKQIRSACCPELGQTEVGDTCYQLRCVLN